MWYSLNIKTIFDNNNKKITKHSFKHLTNFYDEIVTEIIKRDCNLMIEQQSDISKEENDLETKKEEHKNSKEKQEDFYKRLKETKRNKGEINNLIKSKNEEKIKKMKEKKKDNSHYELVYTSNINTHCVSDCHKCYKAYKLCKKYEW